MYTLGPGSDARACRLSADRASLGQQFASDTPKRSPRRAMDVSPKELEKALGLQGSPDKQLILES